MCHSLLAPWAVFIDVGCNSAVVVCDEPVLCQGNSFLVLRGPGGAAACAQGCDSAVVAVMMAWWL